MGRFINADDASLLGANGEFISYNLFAYCLNNPNTRSDPSGKLAITTLILIGSAVFGLGTALYSGYKMREAGESWEDTILYAGADGLLAFGTVYTLGTSAYYLYCDLSLYYGYTPVTEIGSTNGANALTDSSLQTSQHLSGTGSPENNGTPNGSYTKYDNQGNLYSYTEFDSQSRQSMRIDFQGKSHAGVLPHIHVYSYYDFNGKTYRKENTYDLDWNKIGRG